jgi:hypothetical protein
MDGEGEGEVVVYKGCRLYLGVSWSFCSFFLQVLSVTDLRDPKCPSAELWGGFVSLMWGGRRRRRLQRLPHLEMVLGSLLFGSGDDPLR